MSDVVAAFKSRFDGIQNEYGVYFAGHARITRDVGIMDQLINRMAALHTEASAKAMGTAGELPALVKAMEEALELYKNERKAIEQAQASGPDALEAHLLVQWTNFVYHVYRRHFAGHDRRTRDLGLLAECIEDLERIQGYMDGLAEELESPDQALQNARETLARNMELYKKERGEIVAARNNGSLEQQSDILAQVANEQFSVYQAHFSGKPRISRRPGTLQRIVDNLTQVKDRMETLQSQGLRSEANDRNIGIVASRVEFYGTELNEVRNVRQNTNYEELVGALGAAANAVFDVYSKNFAGQDRNSRDVTLIRSLCDELYDIARQMDELDRVKPNNTNQHNLATVLDNLVMYTREHDLIREAQNNS